MKDTEKRGPSRRVFIVEDHPMMRLGLRSYLTREGDIMVCGEAADAAAALAGIEQTHPELVLLDISLEGRSGLDLLRDLQCLFPEIPVLVHSMYDEMIYAERALAAGARGYLMKQESGEKVLLAVRQVLRGETYLSEHLRATGPARTTLPSLHFSLTPIGRLTKREFEVFCLIGQGRDNQEIARQIHATVRTVEAHREHIKGKLKVKTSTGLNLLAVRWESAQSR